MPLTATVSLIVLAVIVVLGVIAYVIDESEERLEQSEGRDQRA